MVTDLLLGVSLQPLSLDLIHTTSVEYNAQSDFCLLAYYCQYKVPAK